MTDNINGWGALAFIRDEIESSPYGERDSVILRYFVPASKLKGMFGGSRAATTQFIDKHKGDICTIKMNGKTLYKKMDVERIKNETPL